MRMYAPSPTVTASPTPLYLRGMGQDGNIVAPDIGAPVFDSSPGLFAPTDYTLAPLTDRGFSADEADLINQVAASGVVSNAQFQDILAGKYSMDQISNLFLDAPGGPSQIPHGAAAGAAASGAAAVIKATGGAVQSAHGTPSTVRLPPGASPRVAAPSPSGAAALFTGKTSIFGTQVPTAALVIGGGLLLLAASGGGR
jgi:hypothetical protein